LTGNTTSGRGTNFDGVNVSGRQPDHRYRPELQHRGQLSGFIGELRRSVVLEQQPSWLVFDNTGLGTTSLLGAPNSTVTNDLSSHAFSTAGGHSVST